MGPAGDKVCWERGHDSQYQYSFILLMIILFPKINERFFSVNQFS